MNQTYTILDFETTGLSPSLERVIEVGAIKVENGPSPDSLKASLIQVVPSLIKSLRSQGSQVLW